MTEYGGVEKVSYRGIYEPHALFSLLYGIEPEISAGEIDHNLSAQENKGSRTGERDDYVEISVFRIGDDKEKQAAAKFNGAEEKPASRAEQRHDGKHDEGKKNRVPVPLCEHERRRIHIMRKVE